MTEEIESRVDPRDHAPAQHYGETLLYDLAKFLTTLSLLAIGGILSLTQAAARGAVPAELRAARARRDRARRGAGVRHRVLARRGAREAPRPARDASRCCSRRRRACSGSAPAGSCGCGGRRSHDWGWLRGRTCCGWWGTTCRRRARRRGRLRSDSATAINGGHPVGYSPCAGSELANASAAMSLNCQCPSAHRRLT